ncbi:DUF1349 domain-containing protein [Microbacterium sp. RURRCA19A]|uniref:DUF1349 domain-containing protein n=1 Tax=Microbacterium sp. RURRCA19A TaxID=1907391 RepID=UPI000970B994|nr:DUF1349 domain-containing protein [Microbacterium sp. RURRCA19A]
MPRLPSLPFDFTASSEADWRLSATGVDVTSSPMTDYFLDPGYTEVTGEYTRLNADTLLAELPEGDFTFTAQVSVDFASDFDAGVLLLWRDDAHWAKLCFELSREKEPLVVSVVTREYADDANAFGVEGPTVWLRAVRMGHIIAFHASTDGETWRMVRVFTFGRDLPFTRFGFLAQSPNGQGCTVRFSHAAFSTDLPADVRAGG